MIRLGIISAATYGATYRGEDAPRTPGSFHGTAFSSTYNGFDEAKAKQWDWTFARAEKRIEGARIVKIWDPHREWAERLAEACYIPEVCETPEDCADDVDGVIIVDDGSTDDSAATARTAGATVLEHPMNQGKGAALKTGFDRILRPRQRLDGAQLAHDRVAGRDRPLGQEHGHLILAGVGCTIGGGLGLCHRMFSEWPAPR